MRDALAYAQRHDLHALVIARGGVVELEAYGGGFDAAKAHALYSGTKAFWGVCALAAARDGLLSLDEPVGETIPAWNADTHKRGVTLRMLLNLTSGMAFGGLGNAVPAFEAALAKPVPDEPGTRFTYGGVPLQVFGAVLGRKLAPRSLSPQEYLIERVLDPAGVRVANWRVLKDGTRPLPTGAFLTARDWLAYGRFVLAERESLAACFQGSAANPDYGLGWWLNPLGGEPAIRYASGSGGQALYLIPARDLIAVHFGKSTSWRHETFLRTLLR
jgi:CubicO group peptidase (beta-lactamase class C family)